MNQAEFTKERGPAEGYRAWIRSLLPRQPTHRDLLAKAAWAEIQKGTADPERLQDCLAEVEDGFWQRAVEPEEFGLTWESWRALCAEHHFEGLTKQTEDGLKSLLETLDERELSIQETAIAIVDILNPAEMALATGNITLEDVHVTPDQWSRLCEKCRYQSTFAFHCVPELFGNQIIQKKYPIDGKHSLEILIEGWFRLQESGEIGPGATVSISIVKNDKPLEKHHLKETVLFFPERVPTMDHLAETMQRSCMATAKMILATRRGFKRELMQ